MDDIRISAIIPTFNRASVIRQALDSVLAQTLLPAEVILVDDGSTDNTRAVLAAYRDRITIARIENCGAAGARNYGVERAQNEWIAFLDSDDYWAPDYLERMAAAIIQTSAEAQFYFADTVRPISQGGRRLWDSIGFILQDDLELVHDATDWVMRRPQPMMLQSSLIHRSVYLEAGGLWDRLPLRHDTHLFLRMGLQGSACAVAGIGAHMTAGTNSATRLTSIYSPSSGLGFQHQVLMFSDVLRKVKGLDHGHRTEFRRRLAEAHRQIARHSWKSHRPLMAIQHAARSAAIDPMESWKRLLHLFRKASIKGSLN